MANVENVLERLGFSPNEIKIYLTLNDRGSSPAGRVAKLAKIDRSSCYNSLKLLLEKGLASYVIVGKVKFFQATGPKRLMDYVKEQESEVASILPELHSRHKAAKVEGQVRLFKGIKGIKTIFLDMIRTGENISTFGSQGQLSERLPEFAPQYSRLLKENNIHTRHIVKSTKEKVSKSGLTEYRYQNISEESYASTNIYGKKVAIIIWTDDPEGIIIENEALAKSYRHHFEILWKLAKTKP